MSNWFLIIKSVPFWKSVISNSQIVVHQWREKLLDGKKIVGKNCGENVDGDGNFFSGITFLVGKGNLPNRYYRNEISKHQHS